MAPTKKGKKPTKASEASLLKQKNKENAESIVAKLKLISRQPNSYADVISNVTDNPSVSEMVHPSIDTGSPISMAPKNEATKKTALQSQDFKKNKAEAEAIVAKLKRIPRKPSRLQDPDVVSKDCVVSQANVVSKTVVNPSAFIDLTAAATSAPSTSAPSTSAPSTSTGNTAAKEKFVYEINCKGVSRSFSVAELQQYIREQLKVDGQKDNCGDTVAICCRDSTVEIRSKTYLPKRYLRFLCKKFLKRHPNIHVVANSTKSYELKYYGAA